MQLESPEEQLFRRRLLNQSITFVGVLNVLHASLEILLNAPNKTMTYVGFFAAVVYLSVPLVKHPWFTSARLAMAMICFGMPYLCVRIWALNGISGASISWFMIFILYAVFFHSRRVQLLVTLGVLMSYFGLLYFSYYHPPHAYADYPFELGALLSAYVLAAILFHMHLTAKAYEFFGKASNKVSLRAVHSQKLIETGRLAGQIAHEVSSPLSALAFINETLFQKLSAQEQERFRELFEQHDMVLTRMSKNLHAILRSVNTATRAKVESMNPENIMSDLHALLSFRLKTGQVELLCDLSGIKWNSKFQVDVATLMQVLVVLANNSLDALATMTTQNPHKAIRLHFKESDDQYEILFCDNGPGVSPENVKKLFTEGFTTKNTGDVQGNGLGLRIAQELLWQMNGDIKYLPDAQGCAFQITLKKLT